MSTDATKCCVCGTATTKRCQPCATTGISLFFCSPEHQKLVWRHHKLVCGSKAHPIQYPFLSEEEADELITFADVPLGHPFTPRSSVASRTNGEDFASYVRSMRQRRPDLPVDEQQNVLFTLRGSLQMAKESLNGRMELPWLKQSFWTHVVRLDTIALQHLLRHETRRPARMPDSLAWSTCRHYGIIFLSLLWKRAEEGPADVLDALVRGCCERYLNTILEQRGCRDPFESQRLLDDIGAELRVVFTNVQFLFFGVGQEGKTTVCCVPKDLF